MKEKSINFGKRWAKYNEKTKEKNEEKCEKVSKNMQRNSENFRNWKKKALIMKNDAQHVQINRKLWKIKQKRINFEKWKSKHDKTRMKTKTECKKVCKNMQKIVEIEEKKA